MQDDKKTVLLHEINFWKENKILPEHYCDYLIALYTQGDESQQPKQKEKRKFLSWEAILSLLFLAFIVAAALITYITAISFGMQTLIMSVFVIILIISWIYFHKKNLSSMLIYITAAFLLLFYSVQLNGEYFGNSTNILYGLLSINCLFWIIGGIFGKKLFFTISGSIGLVLLILLIII